MSGSSIIAVIGGLSVDHFYETAFIPIQGQSVNSVAFTKLPGGKGANTAVAVYRACHKNPKSKYADGRTANITKAESDGRGEDIRVFMNGGVGDDGEGRALRTTLDENGVDSTGVLTLPDQRTGTCAVLVVMENGESSNVAFQGANTAYEPREPNRIECLAGNLNRKPDIVIADFGVHPPMIERMLAVASKSGVETILNPSPPAYLSQKTYKYVTHLILNESEAAFFYQTATKNLEDPEIRARVARYFIHRGVKNVIITLGAIGAFYMTDEKKSGLILAEKSTLVKDTTGAGDSFRGAYAVEYIRQKQREEWNIEHAISFACKAAARTITQLGAQEALPWADEINMSRVN